MSNATMTNWREYDAPLLSPILQSALNSFVTGGFHGTSIRQLAGAAGLSVPGLYHHFASKHAILAEIDRLAMEDLWQRSVAALADGGQERTARFDRLIECLLLFHAHQSDLAFIAFSEIRALKDQHRDAHIAARDRQQKLLDEVVEECVADGSFTTEFPRDASRAITTICTGVSQWYRAGGELDPAGVAERYGKICAHAAGLPAK
ncbi:TetR/AcrR family transcriptional regulator [Brevibacterium sp. JSBI002]|uniref:TetR/AcrR family transcriptional regulator n=1 Tax=Brevibacterium sp. JSBI002 TaxID=2886045 RepID=UPI00222E6E8D|nr:TetR/AcrR family transcriptional regulator [Brevibacterium sp. JSBI002]UZD62598.1 TetR/AcrR family transcriptional regulator [Brevibacterium sp. JSBI002]